jgi:hypothetical protein
MFRDKREEVSRVNCKDSVCTQAGDPCKDQRLQVVLVLTRDKDITIHMPIFVVDGWTGRLVPTFESPPAKCASPGEVISMSTKFDELRQRSDKDRSDLFDRPYASKSCTMRTA